MAVSVKGVTKPYVDAISYLSTREILKQAIDVKNEADFLDILEYTGKTANHISDQPDFHWYENNDLFATATVNGVTTIGGGAGQEVTITIDSNTSIIPGKNFITVAGTRCYVTSVTSATEIKAKPVDPTVTIPVIADNSVLSFYGNSQVEGGDVPQAEQVDMTKVYNYIQTFADAWEESDINALSAIEVEFNGSPHYTHKLSRDTAMKQRLEIAYTLILGKLGKIQETNSNSKTVNRYHTKGLDSFLAGGSVLASQTLSFTTWATYSRMLDAARAPQDFWNLEGGTFAVKMDDVLRGQASLQGGGVRYDSFGKGNAKQNAVDLDFKQFTLYGRTWHRKRLKAMDSNTVTNVTSGFSLAKESYAVPMGKIKGHYNGSKIDRLSLIKQAANGVSDSYSIRYGALWPDQNGTKRVRGESLVRNIGLRLAGAAQGGKFGVA